MGQSKPLWESTVGELLGFTYIFDAYNKKFFLEDSLAKATTKQVIDPGFDARAAEKFCFVPPTTSEEVQTKTIIESSGLVRDNFYWYFETPADASGRIVGRLTHW